MQGIKHKSTFAVALFATASIYGQALDYSKFRAEPVLDVKTENVINAKEFGAIPDDGKNDYVSVKRALQKVKENGGNTRLVFDKGVYDFEVVNSEGKQSSIFNLASVKNFVFDGGGSTFIIRTPGCGFWNARELENCVIGNFTLDYDPLPWTEGTILSVDEKESSLTVKIRQGFPLPEEPNFHVKDFGYLLDPQVPGRIKTGALNHTYFKQIEKVSEGVYKFFPDINLANPAYPRYEKGDRIVYLSRNGTGSLAGNYICKDVTYKDITSYATPSGHYIAVFSERVNVIGCKALIKEGRWKGGNADFVHFQNCRVGPWVENCRIEGVSDDSMVIYSRPMFVKMQGNDNKTLNLLKAADYKGKGAPIGQNDVKMGEILAFLNTETGEIMAEIKVEATDGKQTVRLESPLSFDAAVKEGKTPIQVFNLNMTKDFVIKNNVFRNSRRYGIYWKGSNGVIEGNDFEGLSNEAISIHNEARAPNGPTCRNVYIINNKLRHNGFENGFGKKYSSASISIHSDSVSTGRTKATDSHRNILLRGNVIEDWNGRALYAANVDNLVIEKNVIGKPYAGPDAIINKPAVLIETCGNVKSDIK